VIFRTPAGNNCDTAATNNAGCGVKMNDGRSYGPSLNSNGGGWCVDRGRHILLRTQALYRFAMERTSSFIKVWFWSRAAGGIPSDVLNGGSTVNTDNWVHTFRLR
jgi:hypothetical protein